MKVILLLLLPCLSYAGPYYETKIDTTTGHSTMSVSGYFGVAASSKTPTTFTIWNDGVQGRVGIGTTNPQTSLDITSNSSQIYYATAATGDYNTATQLIRNSYYTDVNRFAQLVMMVSGDSGASEARIVAIEPAQAQSDMAIVLRDGAGYKERLRITGGNGYIGIGTTNPNSELEIKGNLYVDGTIDNDSHVHVVTSAASGAARAYCGAGYKAVACGIATACTILQMVGFTTETSNSTSAYGTPVADGGTNNVSCSVSCAAADSAAVQAVCQRIK